MEADTFRFLIDDEPIELDATGSPPLGYGPDERMSTAATDATYRQDWYERGYQVYDFLDEDQFTNLRSGILSSVQGILDDLGVPTDGFDLEGYHHFVKDDDLHLDVAGRTRDLFPDDFDFPISEYIDVFSRLLGHDVSDVHPVDGKQAHIIVRINRPRSYDFNPPHKDVYEHWDAKGHVTPFVNFWVPIAGVGKASALPMVPGSHRLTEDELLRTVEGGVVAGKKYHVRSVVSWGGRNDLTRVPVDYGDVLIFTPYLVHGCALNGQDDTTRVALEFRLYAV